MFTCKIGCLSTKLRTSRLLGSTTLMFSQNRPTYSKEDLAGCDGYGLLGYLKIASEGVKRVIWVFTLNYPCSKTPDVHVSQNGEHKVHLYIIAW
jgi:hypothetical protein